MTIREIAAILGEIYTQPWQELRAHVAMAQTPVEGIIAFVRYRRTLCALCRAHPRVGDGPYCSTACADADAKNRAIA